MTFKYNHNEYTIVFSGQIYNTDFLKTELLLKNIQLETNSDTEILLKSYICFGPDIVSKLNGIFSFAIWNKNEKSMFLANDKLGIMPLYYIKQDSFFIFSTDVVAILQHPLIFSNISINYLPVQNSIHFHKTIFDSIYKLSPANTILYKNRTIAI